MRWISPRQQNSKLVKGGINALERTMSRWTRGAFRRLSILAILCFAVGSSAWLWQTGWISATMHSVWQATAVHMGKAGLRVEEVLLQGRQHESAERIIWVLGIKQGAPILTVNLQNARKRLEALSWVRFASVEKPGFKYCRGEDC